MIETATRPCGPYSLRLSARLATHATRTFRSGGGSAVLPGGELACAWQNPDGVVVVRAESEAGIERMAFVLGLEDDHSEFLERFADDPVIGRTTCVLKGLRPLRLATVAHSLLRALAGQLVTWQHAKEIERDVIRRTTARHACGLHEPPTGESLGRVGTADLASSASTPAARPFSSGCAARSTSTAAHASDLLGRQAARPGARMGPWSAGVVCLQGLGRAEHGLVGDLGLVKLLSPRHGRRVETSETAALLEPYGEWAGLASGTCSPASGAG